jgi:hypothetical protein
VCDRYEDNGKDKPGKEFAEKYTALKKVHSIEKWDEKPLTCPLGDQGYKRTDE